MRKATFVSSEQILLCCIQKGNENFTRSQNNKQPQPQRHCESQDLGGDKKKGGGGVVRVADPELLVIIIQVQGRTMEPLIFRHGNRINKIGQAETNSCSVNLTFFKGA